MTELSTQKIVEGLAGELTAHEAHSVANRLRGGKTVTQALAEVDEGHRAEIRPLLQAARTELGKETLPLILTAVEVARGQRSEVTPVWTVPVEARGRATTGSQTSLLVDLINEATQSIICSTYNVVRSSSLLRALKGASEDRGVSLRLYVDTQTADQPEKTKGDTLATLAMTRELPHADVFRTARRPDGNPYTNHAKVLVIDRQILVVTSANLSHSAEERNIELGLRVDDPVLACSVEDHFRDYEDSVYERVR